MTHVTIYEFFFASTLDLPDLISKSSVEMNLTPSFILVAGLSDLSHESTKTKTYGSFVLFLLARRILIVVTPTLFYNIVLELLMRKRIFKKSYP